MSFLSELFNPKAIANDAAGLAGEFSRVCPPPEKVGGPIAEARVESALRSLYAEAARVATERRFGVIGRARLARAFQQELFRLGYPAELVSRVTSALTINALVKR